MSSTNCTPSTLHSTASLQKHCCYRGESTSFPLKLAPICQIRIFYSPRFAESGGKFERNNESDGAKGLFLLHPPALSCVVVCFVKLSRVRHLERVSTPSKRAKTREGFEERVESRVRQRVLLLLSKERKSLLIQMSSQPLHLKSACADETPPIPFKLVSAHPHGDGDSNAPDDRKLSPVAQAEIETKLRRGRNFCRRGLLSGGVDSREDIRECITGCADRTENNRAPSIGVAVTSRTSKHCQGDHHSARTRPANSGLLAPPPRINSMIPPKLDRKNAKAVRGRRDPVTLATEDLPIATPVSGEGRVAGRDTPEPQAAEGTKSMLGSATSKKVRTTVFLQVLACTPKRS